MKRLSLYIAALLLLLCLMLGCSNGSSSDATFQEEALEVRYAAGFRLAQGEGYRRIDIVNPWDTTRLLNTYILVDRNEEVPQRLPQGCLLRTPLRNSLLFSSVHCALLKELDCLDAIGGVCDKDYIYVDELRSRLAAGKLVDAGSSVAPDLEQIIDLAPDAILLSPYENSRYDRLGNSNIPIVECADYMETSPLGRAEWVRVFGWLYGSEAVADSLFVAVEEAYNMTCERIAQVDTHPKVITERRTGAVWYVPGGESYMAKILADAGAEYPWRGNESSGSIALSFEQVFAEAQDADFWLIKHHSDVPMSYRSLLEEYAPYARFKAFDKKQIYDCNTQYYRYYEEVPFHPERLLQDLGAIFHPHLFENYTPYYFHPIAL